MNKSKRRIKEINRVLGEMTPTFTTEIQRRDVFHKAISAIQQGMKDMVVNGYNNASHGDGVSSSNVVPRVTTMYKEYANSMAEVSQTCKFG